ncbi:MAG: rRNA pseudouridine synthase [Acidobacteriota bacterium]|jgi:pseudouridine synthase|nr:rRNA pseudouridine synthase [Acidobacteriota bacterium]
MRSKKEMTLDRTLSRFGLASRSEAREAIRSGRVKVNGRVVKDPGTWVDVSRDPVHLDGERLRPVRKCYFLFYKPKGVITSHGDPGGRRTVYDCLGELGVLGRKLPWVAPVGRLDKDTSGLLLLTNDTDFADHVASPESGVPKTYLVKANMLVPDELVERMGRGVELKRGDWARPCSVRRVEDRGKYSWLEIVLTEGKNREVRRLLEAVGLKTLKLVRTRIGPCALDGMQVGRLRPLTPGEVALFRSRVSMRPAG